MAYGSKYTAALTSIDAVWAVSLAIQENGYVGSATALEVVSWKLHYEQEDLEGGFMPSQLLVKLRDTSKTLQADFLGDSERNIRAELSIGGTLVWTGYLPPDELDQPLFEFDSTIDLRFVCGLEYLQGETYTKSASTPIPSDPGRATIAQVISECLSPLSLLAFYRTHANWYPYHATPVTGDPLAAIYADRDEFKDDDGNWLTAREVLETQVAKRFQLKVLQANGAWRLFDPESAREASYTERIYQIDGTAGSTAAVTPGAVDEAAGIGVAAGHRLQGRLPYKKARVTYEHGPKNGFQGSTFSAIQNGGFEAYQGITFENWVIGGARTPLVIKPGYESNTALGFLRSADYTGGSPAGLAGDYVYQNIGASLQNREVAIRLRAKAKFQYPSLSEQARFRQRPMFWSIRLVDKYAFESQVGATYKWFNNSSLQWETGAEAGFIKNTFNVGFNWTFLGQTSQGVTTPEIPSGFGKQVRIYFFNGVDTVAAADGKFKVEWFAWDDVELDYLIEADEVVTAVETRLTNADAVATEEFIGSTFIIGEGPGDGYPRRLLILDGSTRYDAKDFKRGAYSGGEAANGKSLDKQWLERKLVRTRSPRRVFSGTLRLRGAASYWPYQALTNGAVTYECTRYVLDLFARTIDFEGVEILSTSTPTFTEGFASIVSNPGRDANAVAIVQNDVLAQEKLSTALVAITRVPLTGTMDGFEVESLTDGIALNTRLLIANPNGGYEQVVLDTEAKTGQSFLGIYNHTFERNIAAPAGVYMPASEIYSLALQTKNAFGVYLTSHALCTIDGDQQGQLSSITVQPLARDVAPGEDLIISPEDGRAAIVIQVGSAGADEGDTSIPLEGTPYINVEDGDAVTEAYVQFGAKLLVKPDKVQISAEREQQAIGFTTLSAAVTGAAVTSLSVEALPKAVAAGDTFDVVELRERFTTRVTLALGAAQGATSLTINAADFSAGTWPVGSRLRLTDSIVRGLITVAYDNINLRVEKNDVINQINISTEGILIDADNIEISGSTTFTTGFNPSLRADVQHAAAAPTLRSDGSALRTGDLWVETDNNNKVWTRTAAAAWEAIDGVTATGVNVTIRSTTAPTTRLDGTSLVNGDFWVETDDGDKLRTWNGTGWVQSYTTIDGGHITTGTIDAARITIGATTTYAIGYNPSTKTETQRANTAPTTRSDGSALVAGDIWIETDAGDKPYSWTGAAWTAAYTQIDGGVITTGTVVADRVAIGSGTTYATGYNPLLRADSQRATTAPTVRSDGSALRAGDMWADSDDGSRPYTWSGSAWVEGLTIISGDNITTGTISLSRLAVVGSGIKDSTLSGWAIDGTEIVGQASGVDQIVFNTSGQILIGSAATGLIFSSNGIVGNAASVEQFRLRASDGKIVAGAGNVLLDSTGITATAGTIGGWTLGATTFVGGSATLSSTGVLTLGTSIDVAIMSAADATYRLWIGHTTPTSAPFRVSKAGNVVMTALVATTANVSGAITATSGSFAGVSIDGVLTMGASGEIKNSTADYSINNSRIEFAVGSSETNTARGLQWGSNTTRIVGYDDGVSRRRIDITAPHQVDINAGLMTLNLLEDGVIEWNGSTIWHAGNDGSGSGLDADMVDGIHGASFVRADADDTVANILTFSKELVLTSITQPGVTTSKLYNDGGTLEWNGNKIWHEGNDGPGSNLIAHGVGNWVYTELVAINVGIATNAATNMPQYTKTVTLEDAAGNTIKLYGT